ncbi:MAG: polysaccharide pyruvyl transferase family protein [Bacteroidota bacterium]
MFLVGKIYSFLAFYGYLPSKFEPINGSLKPQYNTLIELTMKVGILTYHYSDNYGAVLQAYALSNILNNNGHDAQIINLIPKKSLKIRLGKFFKQKFLTYNFTAFRKNHLKTHPSKTLFYPDLENYDFTIYDAVVVGSDQVWRKSFTGGLGYSYFLDFVPEGVKRISYAASFGLDRYEGNEEDVKVIRELLKRFDLITTREMSGVEVCKNLFDADAHCVLDPVLLNSAVFNDLMGENASGGFVTQYLLDPSPKKLAFLKRASEHLKLPIKINYKQSGKPIGISSLFLERSKQTFPPVSSWLSGIAHSQLIVTDSFHGVAFSILFQKQFVCVFNKARGKTRMSNLLGLLGLEHVGIDENDLQNLDVTQLKPIDYAEVSPKLEKLREHSLGLLLNALK